MEPCPARFRHPHVNARNTELLHKPAVYLQTERNRARVFECISTTTGCRCPLQYLHIELNQSPQNPVVEHITGNVKTLNRWVLLGAQ